jgi:hypothetical protein
MGMIVLCRRSVGRGGVNEFGLGKVGKRVELNNFIRSRYLLLKYECPFPWLLGLEKQFGAIFHSL